MQASSIDIDKHLCNGCGICVKACPARAFSIVAEKAELIGSCTFACDHCAASCPQQAITVGFTEERESFEFASFTAEEAAENPSHISTTALVAMMRARRSCRVYQKRPLSREILEDLVKIGLTAPSGTNSQKWTFTIISSRPKMLIFGESIAAYYKKLNRLAESNWLRKLLKLCGRPELHTYYREYYDSIKEGLSQWYEKKEDRLFHGATAAILIGAQPGASCPQDDALLATQNILLGAESMDLGSCLIGFAVEALSRDRKIKEMLKIPADETIYAVIALGYPAISFPRPAGRRKVPIRWI
ncbi:MAG: nitroreductase family protein [Deltaproteobacteria bacterium]|nr:nitroreductase family protein [Candidatus Tharpella sp.]